MIFDCICGKKGAKKRNLFAVKVKLLDNTISEYSLNKKCSALDCLKKIAEEVNLKEISYFGLKYCGSESSGEKWLDLNKNLYKELKICANESINDVVIEFQIRFFATNVELLIEDTTRYFYYLQLRQNIEEGTLTCNEEKALVLASYALQAEYGDYDSSEHNEDFIEEYQLLPKDLKTEKTNAELYAEIAEKHKNYVGMSTTDSEFAYLKYSHQLECYGHEFHSAKDIQGRVVKIGPCARGVFLKYDSESPMTYFNWPDIVNMMHRKKMFIVETSTLKSLLEMDSAEDAKYIWQTCVAHHQFYRIGDQNKKSGISDDQREMESHVVKRNSAVQEIADGHVHGSDGLCNPAFNDSTLPEENGEESQETSRESGIYGSSESRVDTEGPSFPNTLHDVLNNNETDIPSDFIMASYKTFDNQPRSRQHIEINARSSYPRASPHSSSADKTGQPVGRSVSMIVPSSSGGNFVDACSLQTVATSGYSTSTDSGLSNTKSAALSPMSPVSLISSSSFQYEDYEVPSADEQGKKLEAVMNGGSLDVEFARIKLKDEHKSTASALLKVNEAKNRYPDMLPYEESRVHLDSSSNTSGNDYINASFIKVKVSNKPFIFIATQSPMQSTMSDFLQMIWEQDVKIVVMLYNKKEGSQECHRYWPEDKSEQNEVSKRVFNEFEVTSQFVNKSPLYKSRGLKLRHTKRQQERRIILLQFSHWPHNGIPSDASGLLEFRAEVESIRSDFLQSELSPVVVHCRSGVGRTGVFILADLMIAHLQNQTRQPFNVARVLSKLRSQRMSLIRTVEQYRFVYALLIQYLKNSRLI
ncbi:tyrosine-protein phosphatase non-receptor type 21-like [Dendronephthya gigantea]|uniref:tyrosine-protein phosphatase non-receptor type 21-like n=1 Tax=Dendronephthya gigantea TaxID=151771 RepID=UPI00106D4720|nr:tyrosine-protein phosphatase non-receptor type 21-like [Dendronephthya gigantea]